MFNKMLFLIFTLASSFLLALSKSAPNNDFIFPQASGSQSLGQFSESFPLQGSSLFSPVSSAGSLVPSFSSALPDSGFGGLGGLGFNYPSPSSFRQVFGQAGIPSIYSSANQPLSAPSFGGFRPSWGAASLPSFMPAPSAGAYLTPSPAMGGASNFQPYNLFGQGLPGNDLPFDYSSSASFPGVSSAGFPSVSSAGFPSLSSAGFPGVSSSSFPGVSSSGFSSPKSLQSPFGNLFAGLVSDFGAQGRPSGQFF